MLASIYPSSSILSSTFQESPWEETDNNKSKTAKIIVIGGPPSEPNFKDNYYVYDVGDNFGKRFYAFIKNRQKGGYMVAFKYF